MLPPTSEPSHHVSGGSPTGVRGLTPVPPVVIRHKPVDDQNRSGPTPSVAGGPDADVGRVVRDLDRVPGPRDGGRRRGGGCCRLGSAVELDDRAFYYAVIVSGESRWVEGYGWRRLGINRWTGEDLAKDVHSCQQELY